MISLLSDSHVTNRSTAILLPWYAIRTKSNREKISALALYGKGYEPYLPVYRTLRRWSDRAVEAERPLFAGYIFCRFDAAKRLPILTTPGIISVLGFGNEPAPVSDSEIQAIETVLEFGLAAEPCPFLHEGQRIRVAHGALEGLEGFLLKKKNEWRMVVSITMLQRSISVEIDRESITAA